MRNIFKNITCIALALILFIHINFVGLYCSLYALNKTDLIESVCEKKNACCEAKCYLNRKINEENNNSAQNTTGNKEIKLKISEFLVDNQDHVLSPVNFGSARFINSEKISSGYIQLSDHPPKS